MYVCRVHTYAASSHQHLHAQVIHPHFRHSPFVTPLSLLPCPGMCFPALESLLWPAPRLRLQEMMKDKDPVLSQDHPHPARATTTHPAHCLSAPARWAGASTVSLQRNKNKIPENLFFFFWIFFSCLVRDCYSLALAPFWTFPSPLSPHHPPPIIPDPC